MDGAGAAGSQTNQGNHTMSALTHLGRIFDVTVVFAFIGLSLSLAGATSILGA